MYADFIDLFIDIIIGFFTLYPVLICMSAFIVIAVFGITINKLS